VGAAPARLRRPLTFRASPVICSRMRCGSASPPATVAVWQLQTRSRPLVGIPFHAQLNPIAPPVGRKMSVTALVNGRSYMHWTEPFARFIADQVRRSAKARE